MARLPTLRRLERLRLKRQERRWILLCSTLLARTDSHIDQTCTNNDSSSEEESHCKESYEKGDAKEESSCEESREKSCKEKSGSSQIRLKPFLKREGFFIMMSLQTPKV